MSLLSNHLTIRHLRMIHAIEEEGSIVRAAERLNLTQSAVTKGLQEVEMLAATQLFERSNRGVRPTEAGRIMAGDARRVMAHLQHTEQHLSDIKSGTRGRVTIGTLLSAAPELLPQAIANVRAERPQTVVKIVVGTYDVLMPALRAGEIDMVIGRLSDNYNPENLVQEVLLPDRAVVVCNADHPLVDQPETDMRGLLDWSWILPPKETNLRDQVDRSFREAGILPPVPVVESVSPLINRSLLLHSQYLCVLPVQVARQEVLGGRLTILPIKLPATEGWLGITTHSEVKFSAASHHFQQILRQTAVSMKGG